MSVPPQIIHVKRKRNDDGPVTFLRIEQNTKRHRSGAFLYRHHDPELALGGSGAEPSQQQQQRALAQAPVIQPSRPGEENLPLEAVKRAHATPPTAAASTSAPAQSATSNRAGGGTGAENARPTAAPRAVPSGEPVVVTPQTPPAALKAALEPRRFHLSRNSSSSNLGSVRGSRVSKLSQTALFVERSRRKMTSLARTAPTSPQVRPTLQPTAASSEPVSRQSPSPVPSLGNPVAREQPKQEGSLPYRPKLPSKRRDGTPRTTTPRTTAAPAPKLPDSFMNRWDTDMDQLARDMNDYTLQYIARDLERIEQQDAAAAAPKKQQPASSVATTTAPTPNSPSGSKFKPRAPAKRYAERHPESASAAAKSPQDAVMDDGASESENEADYVIETYVRVAADSVGADVAPDKMGLLVLEGDPDVDFFYGEESESEEEFQDEDDENAENYYTADYPDDEVPSDDEFDRNPYLYRTGNASDLEEFYGGEDDDKDADDSSDEDDDADRFKITIGRQPLPRF